MDLNEWLKKTLTTHDLGDGLVIQDNRPRVVCKDGFSVSIQASSFHYCTPRVDGDAQYSTVECGFPSEHDPLLDEYQDFGGDVYGFVPIALVNRILEYHGGIAIEE